VELARFARQLAGRPRDPAPCGQDASGLATGASLRRADRAEAPGNARNPARRFVFACWYRNRSTWLESLAGRMSENRIPPRPPPASRFPIARRPSGDRGRRASPPCSEILLHSLQRARSHSAHNSKLLHREPQLKVWDLERHGADQFTQASKSTASRMVPGPAPATGTRHSSTSSRRAWTFAEVRCGTRVLPPRPVFDGRPALRPGRVGVESPRSQVHAARSIPPVAAARFRGASVRGRGSPRRSSRAECRRAPSLRRVAKPTRSSIARPREPRHAALPPPSVRAKMGERAVEFGHLERFLEPSIGAGRAF